MGVCGICSPGQFLAPVIVRHLLVPVLSSLLLLLRPLLLLPWHLLLSTSLSVTTDISLFQVTTCILNLTVTAVTLHGRVIVVLFSCSVYEAGKKVKTGPPAQVPVYPYYVPGVPTVVPLSPSSHVDPKVTSVPSAENNLAGGECQWNGAEILESSVTACLMWLTLIDSLIMSSVSNQQRSCVHMHV